MTLQPLEQQRSKLQAEMSMLGDMRPGCISVRYQRCSNKLCECYSADHRGHGPIYSYSVLSNGKTKIKNYKLGPELAKLQIEVENYHRYRALSDELVKVNVAICDLRPSQKISDEHELDEVKKKLEKQFKKKLQKK
jgi:hypothetical protein